MKKAVLFLIVSFCLGLLPVGLYAFPEEKTELEKNPTPAELRLKWFNEHLKLKKESIFKHMKWKSVGPIAMSGRITDIAVPRGNHYIIYASVASGGVWKTVNNGTTWEPIWDNESSNSVGDIAIADSDPNIIWVGAGENNSSRSSYSGSGVYKSTDGGKTWSHLGLSDTHHIGRILIHPKNPDIVYTAAIGHLYTKNEERGVFKTTDGGKTWKKVLYINDNTGVIDLVMNPSDPDILFAAAWDRVRNAWNMEECGEGSGIFKTEDGGENWKQLTNGFPKGELIGRIGLDISVSNPNVIYALVDNHNACKDKKAKKLDPYELQKSEKIIIGAEVYRSDDKGESWCKVNKDNLRNLYSTYGYYFGEIRVSPDNEKEIYILGIPLLRSMDGGKTYENLSYRGLHVDHQAFWIDPKNPDHLVDGNDGGLNFSYDRGKTWVDIKMPLGQFYFVTVDMEDPFNIYGSIQDNGCWYGPVTSVPGVSESWKSFPGGEASYIAIDPSDFNTIYSEQYYGKIIRVDRKNRKTKSIRPRTKKGQPSLRCNWLTPFIISPHNPYILYFGAQKLFMSLDRGDHWQAISPDLTTNNSEKTKGDVPHCTITTISESPLKPGLIYVGTDDGNVQMSRNRGEAWKKIMKGLPAEKWVSRIKASWFDEGTVYISLNGYRDDDFAAYIYKSTDYGETWENIVSNLPGGPVNVIKEDPKKKNIIYAGTDLGVYVSLNQGKTWISLCSNLPTTFVHDLVVHPRDNILVIGTHGRSIYVLDVKIIQELNENIKRKDVYLFSIKPVHLPRRRWESREQGLIYYSLKEKEKVEIFISDRKDRKIKTLVGTGDRGINVAAWNFTTDSEDPRKRFVSPGKYNVTIIAGKERLTGLIELKPPK